MSNSWWEIRIFCDPIQEESIYWRLEDWGSTRTAIEVKGEYCLIRTYIPENTAKFSAFKALAAKLSQDALEIELSPPKIEWKLIQEEDWASSWKQYWQPTASGDRFLIYPAWLELPSQSERLILRLDPGAAFGTGTHPTTQLCLESLEMRLGFSQTNKEIIVDLGCGSGILSIGAVLLGAKQVYAVDIDPLAVSAASENRHLNQIDPAQMKIEQGSIQQLMTLKQEGVDGILCNILAEVIVEMIPQMNAIAKPDTWGILSGILLEQAKWVADTLEEHGWIVATLWKRDEWCCLNIRRSERTLIRKKSLKN